MATEDSGPPPASTTVSFSAPAWLRDLGLTSWFLIGCLALIAAVVWLLAAAITIVGPLVAASIIATVSVPAVSGLQRHRVPRTAGAALVLLALVAVGGVIVVLVIGGITSQGSEISKEASAAVAHGQTWLKNAGVNQSGSTGAAASLSSDVPKAIATLVKGTLHGLQGLTSVIFGLSLAFLSTFFLLKDGPSMRRWLDDHLGVPPFVGQTITGGVIRSLRGYFRGVTIIAGFNAAVITIGALILDVPLAGTIGVVTFVGGVRSVRRRVRVGSVRRGDRARRTRNLDGSDHARHRHPGERTPPEHRAAVCDGSGTRSEPTRRAGRDDRRRLPHRNDRPRAGSATDVGRGAHPARAERCADGAGGHVAAKRNLRCRRRRRCMPSV